MISAAILAKITKSIHYKRHMISHNWFSSIPSRYGENSIRLPNLHRKHVDLFGYTHLHTLDMFQDKTSSWNFSSLETSFHYKTQPIENNVAICPRMELTLRLFHDRGSTSCWLLIMKCRIRYSEELDFHQLTIRSE